MVGAEHDVVIAGGGPAGLSLALHLVHREPRLKGRLVVLEKAHYPREKYCAGALGARGEMALHRIGVEVDVPSAVVHGFSIRLPQGHAVARGASIGRVVRRIEFDHALAQAARSRGVKIEEGVRVVGVEPRPDGVRVQTDRGELRGRVVVGADGVGSAVRRAMGLGAGIWRAQVLEVDTEVTSGDAPDDLLHFDISDPTLDGYFWDFPAVIGGERLACRGVYRLLSPGQEDPLGLEERLRRHLMRVGLDLSGYKKKRYAERGFSPHEPASAPRLLLVGEAAGIDPITGEGIAQALLYGEVAARYLIERLRASSLSFRDWPSSLLSTPLGLDLWVRHQISARYFGPARSFFEEAFLETPAALPLGVDYFAGRPLDTLKQLTAGLQVLQHAWRRRSLSPLRPWLAEAAKVGP